MKLNRTAFIITQRCTLKCKLCIGFMPYNKNPIDVEVNDASKILENYFKMVDIVNNFTITGGEPFLHKNISDILELILKYENRIVNTIDIVTNATIVFKEEVLKILSDNRERFRIIISDYGKKLSVNKEKIIELLELYNIKYKIHNYNGENLLYDGWVDFRSNSLKMDNKNEENDCVFRKGKYYVIDEGELHLCHRSFWRMKNNIISRDSNEFMNLLDEKYDYEYDGKNKLRHMDRIVNLNSCLYCNGARKNSTRYIPAEQIK